MVKPDLDLFMGAARCGENVGRPVTSTRIVPGGIPKYYAAFPVRKGKMQSNVSGRWQSFPGFATPVGGQRLGQAGGPMSRG